MYDTVNEQALMDFVHDINKSLMLVMKMTLYHVRPSNLSISVVLNLSTNYKRTS